MQPQYAVYILTNKNNIVLYTGVTNNIIRRVAEHKRKKHRSFTRRSNLNKLVYYELFKDVYDAIAREKQIKAGSRAKKLNLINSLNPDWRDLTEDL